MEGTVFDIIIAMVILSVVFVAALVGYKVYNEMSGETFWTSTEAGQSAHASIGRTFTVLDSAYIFLLGGVFLSVIISAFFIQSHPVFFVASVIVLIIVVGISPILSNAFMEIGTSEHLSTETTAMPMMTHAMGDLPLIVTVFGFLTAIALYAKYRSSGV